MGCLVFFCAKECPFLWLEFHYVCLLMGPAFLFSFLVKAHLLLMVRPGFTIPLGRSTPFAMLFCLFKIISLQGKVRCLPWAPVVVGAVLVHGRLVLAPSFGWVAVIFLRP